MIPFTARIGELRHRIERAAGPVLLSKREQEVAGLLAEGFTNKEIAGRLYLSKRTVENHVQHILQKLGLANRSQVAAWVASQR